jgi:saccharopine dehydrogenase (NAD+, L-lysine forming)
VASARDTTHLWVRSEQRPNEERVGITPEGASQLMALGIRVTVEQSSVRAVPLDGYVAAGCEIAAEHAWPDAPDDALIFGLKELPEDGTPLRHRHIMFGHAYKGQPAGRVLLDRFATGGGTLYDLEYLVDDDGRRVAAFGYWAGFAGAAIAYHCWIAQRDGVVAKPVRRFHDRDALVAEMSRAWSGPQPTAIIIGALGRVGTGALDFCRAVGIETTGWDLAETARGGPFPEVLDHDIFLNCILARPGSPVFVPADAVGSPRRLGVIGDIACDPTSDFSPIKVYDRTTTWNEPALRVADSPPLDVTAIDNLPSLLPIESSEDYAAQLLPSFCTLGDLGNGVWRRAEAEFHRHLRPTSNDSRLGHHS